MKKITNKIVRGARLWSETQPQRVEIIGALKLTQCGGGCGAHSRDPFEK